MSERTRPWLPGLAILNGLQPKYRGHGTRLGPVVRTDRPIKHIYAGTVDPAVADRRHAANKVARKSRRINRQRAGR